MLLHLAEQLEVPLRDRNHLLLAAGYAPVFAQRELDAPEMGPVRDAIDQVLRGHEPYPALVIDRHWGLSRQPCARVSWGRGQELLEPRSRPAAEHATRWPGARILTCTSGVRTPRAPLE